MAYVNIQHSLFFTGFDSVAVGKPIGGTLCTDERAKIEPRGIRIDHPIHPDLKPTLIQSRPYRDVVPPFN